MVEIALIFTKGLLKTWFRAFISILPANVRYFLSLLAFWPTAILNRTVCALTTRRLWNRIDKTVVLGSVPLLATDVLTLHRDYGVRGVVNMCREWRWHRSLYAALTVAELYCLTIDYDIPELESVLTAMAFIREHETRGESVYVHCKAGRGRSTVIVLCYLILYRGMSPQEADSTVRAHRPHVSIKWRAATVQYCAAHRSAILQELETRVATTTQAAANNRETD